MTTTWYYPNVYPRRAPRDFHCTCGVMIVRGSIYFKHNHGRYCHSCSKLYRKEK